MFSSGSGDSTGFDSFGTQNTNLFGSNQGIDRSAAFTFPGPTAVNPFQSNDNVRDVQTKFGQSSGFGNQPPLPSSSLAGARKPEGDFDGFSQGGLARTSSMVSSGFGRTATSGNPFGQMNQITMQNNNRASLTFGSTSFGHNGNLSSTSTSTRSSFGSASEAGGNLLEPNHERGVNEQRVGDFDNRAPVFGANSTPFRGKNGETGGGQTVFGTHLPKRGQSAFSQESNGFGSANTAASTPFMSQSTAFGSQSSGTKVQKKRVTPNAATPHPRATTSFAAAATSGEFSSTPYIQTTFGAAASINAPTTSQFVRKPFSNENVAATSTFGGFRENRLPALNDNQEALVGRFTSANKTDMVEKRMSGTNKASLGPSKRAKGYGTRAEADTNHFGEHQSTASYIQENIYIDDIVDEPKLIKSSRTKENVGKHRKARPKKRAPKRNEEEASFISVSPSKAGGRDESNKAQLSAAANLDGLCTDMCSQVERELHIRVDELSVFEKCYPGQYGTERDTIIKRFQRSSADHKLDIPDEIRPPGVLRRTQLYIEQAIMDLDRRGLDPRFQPPRAPEPIELYNFCWDRFRMIRKDFILQNYRGAGGRVHPIVLDIHERIARYHVLSEHELIETPSFVAQQNMEQLGQTLKSLNELYDESHKVGDAAYFSPFEAEFRAYFILCTLDNGRGMDVLKYVKDLPHLIVESRHIKFAMRVFVARQTGDYYQFFSLLREATYLQSCLLSRYIPNVRSSALLRMNRSYRSQTYPLEDLANLLCFDDIEHAYSVCHQHQIGILGRPDIDDDSEILLKFGGNFETDTQLRRNDRPLKIRGSKIFVAMKQGNFLRRDVCRGVTEYPRDQYPALSKLIQETEQEEQARLYPDRPLYEDEYSYFVDYTDGDTTTPTSAQAETVDDFSSEQHQLEIDQKRHDLKSIAQKKLELEQERRTMLERMRSFEQAKEEQTRRERYMKAAAEEAAQREEQMKRDALAQATAENEAAEARRRQGELEARLREQKQRELEEQRKMAEMAQEAERQRLAALQQAEVMRAKAAEEERYQQEERQKEIWRKAAEEFERRRQQELAEERARQAREAALEAQRRAQLAEERAERKRARRAEKQRFTVLKLRLHLWKKYVQVSRNGPGPISIDATKLRLDRPHQKAKDSIQWLFNGADRASAPPMKKKRLPREIANVSPSDSDILSLWCSEDIQELVSGPLCRQNPGIQSIAWKLVIADLMDGAVSSFGLWCAVKAGAQNVSVPEHDCHRTFQWVTGKEQGVAVCSRYLDSTFSERNTHKAQQEKLAATSAILLPVDMSTLHLASNCSSWEQQVGDLLASLNRGCQVTLLAVGFASAEVKSFRQLLVRRLESCVERLRSRFALQVVHARVEVIDAGDSLPHKFRQVLKTIAVLSSPMHHLKSVGLKELLESSMGAMMNQFESSIGLQSNICEAFRRVHENISTSGVMDLTYAPPELRSAVVDPSRDWNSQERRHEMKTVLTALEVTRIAVVDSPLTRDEACDVYFKRVASFIDRLFASHAAASAVSTYELKKSVFGTLLSVHELLTRDGKTDQVTPRDADVLLPWREVFKEIYATFFETLDGITIYYPADWRKFGATVSSAPSSAWTEFTSPSGSFKKAKRVVVNKPVSVQSIRKSFGRLKALDGAAAPKYRVMDEMERLRAEIKNERAATSQFQRMLRQALIRWDT
uniref:SAC3/GANP/THP3 conserved domain-containing protein n=1 Tax=Hyaloperonospora arabidopsidis (strain Emoy2) TaxID=559515 RepID=M4C2H3_HYAAE